MPASSKCWPRVIPSNEASSSAEDANIHIFDASYLEGSTSTQDPTLLYLIRDTFLTPLAIAQWATTSTRVLAGEQVSLGVETVLVLWRPSSQPS